MLAQIKKLQPSSAVTGGRKKSGGGGGAGGVRKSALKKSKGGTRAMKSDAAKRKGAAAGALSVLGGALVRTKAAGALAWGSRNLFFFAAAVAAMHLQGDYLAV